MRPVAVILDFDGVVVASLPAHLAAWQAAVAEVFARPLPDAAELAGHATRTIAHILCKKYGDRTVVKALVRAKERHLAAGFAGIPLIPGARELIEAAARRPLPHGIASNSPRAFVQGALTSLGLSVPVVVTGEDAAKGKPAPDLFWACANRLGVAPGARDKILVFEDSRHGIEAARRAGMTPVGVTTEASPEALRQAGAAAVCKDLAEALARGWLDEFTCSA